MESESNQADELNGWLTDVFTDSRFNEVPLLGRSAPRMNYIVVSVEGVHVTKLLKGRNLSKTMGPDELHPRILEELAAELGQVFAYLFQQSLDTGKIPYSLANVCPLFKKDDRALASNQLPVLSGVPQGTVLGPFLFSGFFNDKTDNLDSEIGLFVDDCVCYCQIHGIEDTVKLQSDIDSLGK